MATVQDIPTTIAPVHIPGDSRSNDLRAVKVVWHRELIRFSQDRIRMGTSLVQPLLFLFVLGTGMASLTKGSTPGVSLRTIMYPGVLAMATMFTAVFSSVSIVWDREFGFLREMLVAPVRRGALLLGKTTGGATTATIQGTWILAMAGFVGVPYNPVLMLTLLAEMLLLSFTMASFGLVLAVRVKQMQSVMGLMQMLIMPLLFLSGALFPLGDLPTWLRIITRLNPLTYIVNPMRTAVFDHITMTAAVRAKVNPPLTWLGWPVPIGLQLLVVAVMGVSMLMVATHQFNKPE